MRTLFLSLVSVVALVGCSDVKVASRQENGNCPTSGINVAGAPGTACTATQNCSEFCCITSCGGGGKKFVAAACIDGQCADSSSACEAAVADNGGLCAE